VPRPPEIAVPPTTTAAMTSISKPTPTLGSTCGNRTACNSDASPVSAPITTKTVKTTRRGRTPASRAASWSDPTAYTARPAASQHGAHGELRADRDIDVAREDDEGHADRDDQHRRERDPGGGELVAVEGRADPREDEEKQSIDGSDRELAEMPDEERRAGAGA